MDLKQRTLTLFQEDIRDLVDILSDEEAGKLFRAIIQYNEDGSTPSKDDKDLLRSFVFIKNQIDRIGELKTKRAEAGRRGGMQNHAEANRTNDKDEEEKADDETLLKQNEANNILLKQNEAKENLLKQTEAPILSYPIPSYPIHSNTKENMSGKPDPASSHREEVGQIIDHLNDRAKKHYRSGGANAEIISARLNDGYSVDDCIKVVDNMTYLWSGDGKMEQYLRPETLFKRSHFESYLNSVDGSSTRYHPEDEKLEF